MRSFYETMLIVESSNNPYEAFSVIPKLIAEFEKLVSELESLIKSGGSQALISRTPLSLLKNPPAPAAAPVPAVPKKKGWLGGLFGSSNESFQESFVNFNLKLNLIKESNLFLESNMNTEVARIVGELKRIVSELKSNFEIVQDFSSMLNSAMQKQFKDFQGELTQGMQSSFRDVIRGTKNIDQEELMFNIADLTQAIHNFAPKGDQTWIKIYPGLQGSRERGSVNIPYNDREAHALLAQKAVKKGAAIWRIRINKPSLDPNNDVFEVDMTSSSSVNDAISWIQTTAVKRYEKYLRRQKNKY